MIKKIYTTNLKPGMYVIESGLSKNDNPHIYSKEGEIENTSQIQDIISAGYLDVFIDSNKGSYFKSNPSEKVPIIEEYETLSVSKHKIESGGRSFDSMGAHIEEAELVYKNSLDYVKDLVDSLKFKKKIDFSKSEECINDIFSHINNNIDSLLFISKLKKHDTYTYTHNLNVSIFSIAFASAIGLGEDNIKIIGLSGLFHDIGKLYINEDILNKPDKLTAKEFEEIKKHPTLGFNILQKDKNAATEVCKAAHEHHEKHSGGGYPQSISYKKISTYASLISIIDVFDALTSNRSYKRKIDLHKALGIIFNLKGTSFYPALVDKFIKFLGIYPVGSIVLLSSGEKAIVTEQNSANLLRPKIRIVMDKNNHYQKVIDLDLVNERTEGADKLDISECLSPENCRINISDFLR
ncbi:HD-GYP domain-containing protein [Solidesulfovibrio magneticus]|uniref:HD-GYP domain-containing protein n=1 Tax=Solidesulfovibrio magneticus (strain ATCC 700980 / DSM 13731 / RS-1) TaxID=573370 RepID=C4XJC8_SOLM1|nr:HD-GYP domain-containing protein [Solidesulfovibrio magneticus]BAH76678.1 hypothetical protein DMR_31870 [Solidesulfovibrio magneticus RS-1]